MGDSIQIITTDNVKINVSNSQNNVVSFEKRFDKKLSIAELKVSILVGHMFLEWTVGS